MCRSDLRVAILGLNLLTGFAGLISIGHAAFVGVGAYTVASFSRVLGDSHVLLTHAWPLMILIAGGVGALVGALVGLPALRLKHLYLTIATLSFQMIFQWTINFMTFFNQGQTISIGRVFWFTGEVDRKQHYFFWYYVILITVVIFGFAVRNLLRSRYGRCLVAVRDNDRAADAMGMHPGFTKVYAFALAGSAAENFYWTTSYKLTSVKGEGTSAQLALAKRYGRDEKTANSQNYTNGVQVTQIAVEAIRRAKARGLKISRESLYNELLAMNGYNAYYPLTTVGPVTYSKTDKQGVDVLQLYRAQDGVFQAIGSPFTSEYVKKIK